MMQVFLKLKNRFAPKGSFKANVLTLMTGTVIAQVLTVAISPILTRLFSPEDFGGFGVYMSLVSILTAVVTLRYDQALMLPKENEKAAALFWSSIIAVGCVSLLTVLISITGGQKLVNLLKLPDIHGWIFFLPLSVFLGGLYLTLNSWSSRQKQFKRASFSQMTRATTVSGVQLSSGAFSSGVGGLISGAVLGDLLASFVLGFQVYKDDRKILKDGCSWNEIKVQAKQYSDFPLFSSTQNLLNAVSHGIPLLLLARFFGPEVAGLYALGFRVLLFPMNLVLVSLRQVFFQRASEVYNSAGDTYGLFKRTTFGLMKVVFLPALIIFLFAPSMFSYVFGKQWLLAGEFSRWLTLWLALAFINPPATIFIQIYRKQKVLLFQDVLLLVFRIVILIAGGFYLDPLKTIVLYSAGSFLFYVFIIGYVWLFLKKQNVIKRLKNS